MASGKMTLMNLPMVPPASVLIPPQMSGMRHACDRREQPRRLNHAERYVHDLFCERLFGISVIPPEQRGGRR